MEKISNVDNINLYYYFGETLFFLFIISLLYLCYKWLELSYKYEVCEKCKNKCKEYKNECKECNKKCEE